MGNNHDENKKDRPTLSVLMAVYHRDRSDYLDRALRSVWDEQTYRPEAIILVEDGELDMPLYSTIAQWKTKMGSVLRVFRSKRHVGLTKCLNIGLRQVRTSLVARMDSDDISTPDRFERQVEYLQQHPEVDIVGGATQEFCHDCGCLGIRHYPLTHEKMKRYMLRACPLSHPTVMMRMRIFQRGLKYDERFTTSQDIALWFDAVARGFRMGNLDEVVLRYRRENEFYARRSKEKARNECMIYLRGIYHAKGLFSLAYIYPLARYCLRLLPTSLIRAIYNSNVRDVLLKM